MENNKKAFIKQMHDRFIQLSIDFHQVLHNQATSDRYGGEELINSPIKAATAYRMACDAEDGKEFQGYIRDCMEELNRSIIRIHLMHSFGWVEGREYNRIVDECESLISVLHAAHKTVARGVVKVARALE